MGKRKTKTARRIDRGEEKVSRSGRGEERTGEEVEDGKRRRRGNGWRKEGREKRRQRGEREGRVKGRGGCGG